MKKITSILFALAIVLSANAGQRVVKPQSGKTKIAKEQVATLPAHVKKTARVAQAKADGETIVVAANNLSVDDIYNGMMLAFAGYGFVEIAGGNDDYSVEGVLYPSTEDYYVSYSSEAEDISLTVTDAEKNEMELTVSAAKMEMTAKGRRFTATGVSESGDTYEITLTLFAPDEPKQTIELAFESCTISDYRLSYGSYIVWAEKENIAVQLAIKADAVSGTLEAKDIDLYYTDLFAPGDDGEWEPLGGIFAATGIVTETETGKELAIELWALDENLYKITITYTKPVAETTQSFELDNAAFEDFRDWDGTFQIEAANADSSFIFVLNPQGDELTGNYTVADLDGYYSYVTIDKKDSYNFAEGEFTITKGEGNILIIEGWLLATNNVKYEFVIRTSPITSEDDQPAELSATITGSDFALEIYPEEWVLEGECAEEMYVAFNGKSATVAGSYTEANLDNFYTYVTLDGETYYDLTTANLVVTYENQIITIKGTMTCTNEDNEEDVREFIVDVTGTYTIPTERHYEYDAADAEYNEIFTTYQTDETYYEEYGLLILTAGNDNKASVAIGLYPQEGQTAITAGEYTITNSSAAGTALASTGVSSQGNLTYSFAGYKDEEGYMTEPLWFMVGGTVTVTEKGDIIVNAVNSYNKAVKFVINVSGEAAVAAVAAEHVASKRLENGQMIIEKNGVRYSVFGTTIR